MCRVIFIMILAVALTGCASLTEKRCAKENAQRYMEEKYGISPKIKSTNGIYGGVLIPTYTGTCKVIMDYEGNSFEVIASDDEGDYQSAKDNYENQLVKREMDTYLKTEFGALKEHSSFTKFQNIEDKYYALDKHISTSDIMNDSENEMCVVLRVYGLDEAKYESVAKNINSEHKNWNIFIYNFLDEDLYDKYGTDDDSKYVFFDGFSESFLEYYPTYAVEYLKSFAYLYNGEINLVQFKHDKVDEFYITYESDKPVTIESTDREPAITEEDMYSITNYYNISGSPGSRYTISYIKPKKIIGKIGVGFYNQNLEEGEYEFERIYLDPKENNSLYAKTFEIDNNQKNGQMFALLYKKE